jgi:hypothetical protein
MLPCIPFHEVVGRHKIGTDQHCKHICSLTIFRTLHRKLITYYFPCTAIDFTEDEILGGHFEEPCKRMF